MAGFLDNFRNKIKNNTPQYGAYDIRGAGQYGLQSFDPNKTRSSIDTITQRQIDKDTGRAFRQGIVGGDFNPESSAYEATQSARDARNRSLVDLDKYTYESQFPLMNALLGIDQNKLAREGLEFQKYQYEDSKPSFWTGLLDFGLGAANALIPFEEGGVIPKTDDVYANGGVIPDSMANMMPVDTADNTVIKAKTGEGILTDKTTQVLGGSSAVDALNKIGEIQTMFSPDFKNKLAGQAKTAGFSPNSMMSGGMGGGGNMGFFNPYGNQGMGAGTMGGNPMMNMGNNITNRIKGMFGGNSLVGSSGAHGYQAGGIVGDPNPFKADYDRINSMYQNMLSQYETTTDPTAKEQIGSTLQRLSEQGFQLAQKMQQWDAEQRQKQGAPPNPYIDNGSGSGSGSGDANNNGIPDNQEQTITIKTKPAQNLPMKGNEMYPQELNFRPLR